MRPTPAPSVIVMCPHCGREYSSRATEKDGLIPPHRFVVRSPADMSAAALDAGALEEEKRCPGSGQIPRNPETDMRPLWKDLPAENANA